MIIELTIEAIEVEMMVSSRFLTRSKLGECLLAVVGAPVH